MQKLVSKYGLAAHLAILAVAPSVLLPFCGAGTVATTLLWLSLVGMLWIVLEPSRRADEMLHEARVRTLSGIVCDPLFWLLAVVAAFAAVRWANGGIAVAYDAQSSRWSVARPAVSWLPGSVAGEGFLQFAVAVALCCVVSGCRHALGKSARTSFVFCSGLFAGAGALSAVVLSWAEVCDASPFFALDSSVSSFAGPAFGMFLLGSVAALAGGLDLKWNKLLLLFSFSIGSCALGLFYFAPARVVILFAALLAVELLVSAVCLFFSSGAVGVLRFFAAVFIASVLPVFVAVFAAPEAATSAKLAAFAEWSFFPEGFWELRARLSDIAAGIWRGHVWLGSGLGAFPLEARFLASESDWASWGPSVPRFALNGGWHLLAERGIAGAAAIVLPALAMIAAFAYRLVRCDFFRAFFPVCVLGPLVAGAYIAEAFFDVSFLNPACILAAASIFALSAGAFPPARKWQPDGVRQTGEK